MQTNIDITHIPFSRYGAYVSVTRNEGVVKMLVQTPDGKQILHPVFVTGNHSS